MGAANQPIGYIDHYVVVKPNVNVTPVPYYLGTAVVAPEPEHSRHYLPVMNDLGGRSVPFQIVQDGEDAVILSTLNRFDYTAYKGLRVTGGDTLGSEGPISRGTLVIGLRDFELWLVYGYVNAQGLILAPVQADTPPGRRYFSCTLESYKESPAGARVQEIALAIRANNVFNPQTRTFSLYTESFNAPPTSPN